MMELLLFLGFQATLVQILETADDALQALNLRIATVIADFAMLDMKV
tara:strand:- start:520 stop:660 length:141 start_codon:yes stop_codon:yes gene_type:complete